MMRDGTPLIPGAGTDAGAGRGAGSLAGAALMVLPDALALVAGSLGAVRLPGWSGGLCAAAGAVATVGCVLRLRSLRLHREAVAPSDVRRRLLASLPALVLLGAVLTLPAAPRSTLRSTLEAERPDAVAATAGSPAVRVDDVPAEQRACLESAAVKPYLDALHARLMATWDARERTGPAGFAVLAFVLDAQGGVGHARVVDQSSEAYRERAREALAAAAPFGPLGAERACLQRFELRATLERSAGP